MVTSADKDHLSDLDLSAQASQRIYPGFLLFPALMRDSWSTRLVTMVTITRLILHYPVQQSVMHFVP